MAGRGVRSMFYWEYGERGLVMDEKRGTQNNYDIKFSERKLHASQRGVSKKETSYKDPEEFPQWESPEEVFDIQQFMQEIM